VRVGDERALLGEELSEERFLDGPRRALLLRALGQLLEQYPVWEVRLAQ
jgi:hypothetical protein